MPADAQRIQSIFLAALEAADPTDRAVLLARECGGDAELRRCVEALLLAHANKGSLPEKPAASTPLTSDLPAGQWINRDAQLPVTEGPGTRVGRFKLLQQIGEGGMGAVYMAEQDKPVRRRVALKIIKPGMDSAQVIARFEVERQALAMMDHPNIAKVLDAGTTESGRPYFVMELVYGVPITKFCDDSQMTPRERLELFVPICQAIQHAHQKGIIHRDIKPSNVLVTMHDDKPVPKVIDFGVAKATEQHLTEKTLFTAFGTVVGTYEYMSPEQAEMNAFGVDTRSDVYSLGVLLYELLTGTTPLERKRLREAAFSEMVRLIKEVEPPRPSVRLSSSGDLPKIAAARKTDPGRLPQLLRGEIDWIVMRCLEKDRTRRYESASALARDVERYLNDEAVEACPPSIAYRLRKFSRKYRVALATVAAFAALLLIASGVSIWLAIAAKQAEAAAKQAEAIANERSEAAEKAEREAANERDRAQREWQRAEEAANQAKANAAETGRALDRIMVAKGIQLAEEGRIFSALQQFIKPLERGGLSPEEEQTHRTRIACYLRYTPGRPRLRHMFFCDKTISESPWQSQVTFSADGKRMLAVGEENVYVWDIRSGIQLAALKCPNGVQHAQFTPDGTHVLTSEPNAIIGTWNVASGRRLDAVFVDWAGLLQRPLALLPLSPWQWIASRVADFSEYSGLFLDGLVHISSAISRDAKRALFTFPRTVRWLDLETHKLYGQWPNEGFDTLSPDGRCLLHVRDGVVWVHDASTEKLSSRSLDHGSRVESVAYSPDGARAVTLGEGVAQVWDSRTWKSLTRVRVTDSTKRRVINTARFSPDNRFLVCWERYWGNLSWWWDVESGQFVGEAPGFGNDFGIFVGNNFGNFDWRPDGRQLVRVSKANGGEATVWDAEPNGGKVLVLPHFGVFNVAYAPDGRTLATVGGNGVICLWDFCDQEDTFAWQEPEEGDFHVDIRLHRHLSHNSWTNDGKGVIDVKTISGSKPFPRMNPERFLPPGASFHTEILSPDRNRVITSQNIFQGGYHADGNRLLQLWDANTKRAVGKPLKLEEGDCYKCVAFSPDGRMFATTRNSGVAQLYNARTGELVGKPLKHDGPVFFAAFSPDSELVVTTSADSTARLWRTKNGEPCARQFRHGDQVTCAAFTPNGKIVATGSLDGTLRLWNADGGASEGVLELKNSFPLELAFHPNGSLLIVSFRDRRDQNISLLSRPPEKIQLFDIVSLQEVSPAVQGLTDNDNRLRFRLRKDGRFAFGVFDRRTWDLNDTRPVRDLTKLAQLYSGQRTEAKGDSTPLSKQELQSLWQELHTKYPEEFRVSPKAAVQWRSERLQSVNGIERPAENALHRRWLAVELSEAGWQPGLRGNEDMELEDYYQRLYALVLHGRHAETVAAADALANVWSKDAATLYHCVCIHALAAGVVKSDAILSERFAARAVALLQQAYAAGKDVKHILKDSDLDALRRREDFRRWLKPLEEREKRDNELQKLFADARNGRHVKTAPAADALASRWSKDADTLYNCACVLALAAKAVKDDAALVERYAARAVALLQQAVAAGYNNGQHMLEDSDLDALRQRDDFRMLLKKLDAKRP